MTQTEPPPEGESSGQPAWPDVSKRSRGLRSPVVLVAASAAVLAACGLGGVGLIARGGSDEPAGSAPPPVTIAPSAQPTGPVPSGSGGETSGDAPSPARAARAGDCLHIEEEPGGLVVDAASCEIGEYLVVRRFDGTTDGRRCAGAPDAPRWYRWDEPGTTRDFVLCLRFLGP